jgi:hypothetical protein
MGFAGSLVRRYAERRFTTLFVVLMLTISGHALVGSLLPLANPLEWLLGLSLVAVVLTVRRGRLRWILYAATVGLIGARLVQPMLDHPAPAFVAQSLFALACLLTAGVAVRRALGAGPVDGEHIFAALDAYVLVGIAFGVGYWMLETALPGSFSSGEPLTAPRAIYFSFVTQTTLGYGDIAPISEHAQGVVVAQGMGGQMYLAVLIARLVSLYAAREDR